MTKRHIGELHVYKRKNSLYFEEYNKEDTDFIFDYCERVWFKTKDSIIVVKDCNVSLLEDKTLQIDTCFYNDELFEVYRSNCKLKSIIEEGFIVDRKGTDELLEYSREYKNYKFLSAYTYEDKNQKYWRYILKPCL